MSKCKTVLEAIWTGKSGSLGRNFKKLGVSDVKNL